MNLPASDVIAALTHARDTIEAGWCQGRGVLVRSHGGTAYCAVAAIAKASRSDSGFAICALLRAIPEAAPTPLGYETKSIVRWNDTPGRTKEEVLAVFDRAINMIEIDQELSALKEEEYEPVCS